MPRSQLLRVGSKERATVAEQLRRGMAGGGVGAVPSRAQRSGVVWWCCPGATGRGEPLTYRRGAFLPEGASEVEQKERSDESGVLCSLRK